MNNLSKRITAVATLAVLSLLAAVPLVYADDVDPTASFTFAPSNPVVGEQVTFTSTSSDVEGSIQQHRWDLDNDGDYDNGNSATATRTYTSTGIKTVGLRVTDDEGERSYTSRTFTVAANGAPTAAFTATPPEVDTGQTVTFSSSSTDPEGRALSHAWDLDNDGSFDDGTATTASTSFASDGTRTVRLRVTDSGGTQRTAVREIVVRNRAPVAGFTTSTDTADTGQSISFSSTSTDPDGSITAHRWDFDGNGTTDATGPNVSRSFAQNGTPTVTLTVVDNDDGSHTATRQLTIRNRAPVAGFDMSVAEVDSGDAVTFTSSSTDPDGTVTGFDWDFDDDGVTDETGANVERSFANSGTYTVRLTATDDDGGTHSTTRLLKVRNRPPSAGFGFSPANPVAGDPIALTSTAADSDGTVAEHRWDLDNDGAYDDAAGAAVSTTFAAEGSYVVGHEAVDDDGAATASFQTIEVAPRPAQPPPSASDGGDSQTNSTPGATSDTANALAAPSRLAPFPLVRIKGVTTRTGARLDMLSVSRVPGNARLTVRCRGRGCPFTRWSMVRRGAAATRTLTVPKFKRRSLRAGAVIEVFVTRADRIGKYTRFTIRGGLRPPKRVDGCAAPGRARVQRCPS